MRRNPLNEKLNAGPRRLMTTGLLLLILMPLLFLLPLRQIIFLSQTGEMRRMVSNDSELEKMIFTSDAFSRLNFLRDQREFIYRGNQYDVYSITKSGNQVVVLALWDTIESAMLQAYQTYGAQDYSRESDASTASFMPYFRVDHFCPDFKIASMNRVDFHAIFLIYSNPYLCIGSPPPELLTSF
jgi:hypothetical protein